MCREDVVYVIGEFHLVYSWVGETKVIEGVGLGVLVPATQATVMVVFKIHSMCGTRNCDLSAPIELETVIYRPQLNWTQFVVPIVKL